jgi:hypothetical protein
MKTDFSQMNKDFDNDNIIKPYGLALLAIDSIEMDDYRNIISFYSDINIIHVHILLNFGRIEDNE